MGRGNFWQEMIRFINYQPIDSIITRPRLARLYYGYIPEKTSGIKTFDEYRRLFCNLGYLERLGRGQYKVVKRIPDWLRRKNAAGMDRRNLRYVVQDS
jgi:hypothetical protein